MSRTGGVCGGRSLGPTTFESVPIIGLDDAPLEFFNFHTFVVFLDDGDGYGRLNRSGSCSILTSVGMANTTFCSGSSCRHLYSPTRRRLISTQSVHPFAGLNSCDDFFWMRPRRCQSRG